jgi:DNA-3-methyladenine glycosylase II
MTEGPSLHPNAAKAAKALKRADPLMATLISRVGPCLLPAPRMREPFESLLRAIAHQQLHARAAEAILGRFLALFPGDSFPEPMEILTADPSAIRAAGMSASKIAAIQDLCARRMSGTVPSLAEAHKLSNDELIERLTAIRGIGHWSVEMLLIFGLGRPDVLPIDDFGVREGYRKVAGLDAQPKPKALGALGEAWAPWRSFASWYLWRANEFTWGP